MDRTLFQRAQHVFEAVCELGPAEQPAAVRAACGGDEALRAVVEDLLSHDVADTGEGLVGDAVADTRRRIVAGPAPLEPGLVVERFVVERMLGRGATAQVWQVRHQQLGTAYALKVLTWDTPAVHRRVMREARSQARLDHPNLVPVLDLVPVNGTPALLMPLVRGPTLEAVLAEARPSVHEAVGVVRAIAGAVAYAHAQGLCHRDLKPANVLLEWSGGRVVPRVVDFGLVRDTRESTLTLPGVVLGTPSYAAPEQLAALRSDHRADLWALGVLLYELLVGRRPFPGPSLERVLAAQERGPDLEGVPPALRDLVRALLVVDPDTRLGDAAALVRRLPEVPPLGAEGPLGRAVAAWAADDPPEVAGRREGVSGAAVPDRPARWRSVAAAAALVGVLGYAAWSTGRRPAEPIRDVVAAPAAPAAPASVPPTPRAPTPGSAPAAPAVVARPAPKAATGPASGGAAPVPAAPRSAPTPLAPARIVVEGLVEQARVVDSAGNVHPPGPLPPGEYTFEAVLPTRGNLVREPLGVLVAGSTVTVRCNDAFGHCAASAVGGAP